MMVAIIPIHAAIPRIILAIRTHLSESVPTIIIGDVICRSDEQHDKAADCNVYKLHIVTFLDRNSRSFCRLIQ